MTTILITPLNAGPLSYYEGYTDATLVYKVQQNFMQYFQWKKSVSHGLGNTAVCIIYKQQLLL
jgi:hypothetical protein